MPTVLQAKAHATAPPIPPTLDDPLSLFDNEANRREGWELVRFTSGGTTQVQLCRVLPEPGVTPAFEWDWEVWDHAVRMARAGSELFRLVLNAVDDTERMLIEAACGTW